MRTIKLCFYGLLVVLFSIFILQNYSTLTYSVVLRLNLGFLSLMSVPLPLFLAVPLFFFCGLFLATIYGWGERRRLSREIKQLKSSQAGASNRNLRRSPNRSPSRNPSWNPKKNPGKSQGGRPNQRKNLTRGPLLPLFLWSKKRVPRRKKTPLSIPDFLSVYD